MEFHIFVVKGDEMSLQRALYMIHRRSHNYVVFLFYASWCPFSITFRPIFSVLSSLFPSIPHFAIEESAIKPSTLSKYGVHGLPTLFILNSTMRVQYHGPRTLDSLITFYNGVTGVKTSTEDGISLDKIGCSTSHDGYSGSEQESCPFSWARSPENLLRQETYLMLATVFVLMRFLYALLPYIRRFAQFAYRSYNMRISSLWEHPLLYMHRGLQLFNSLKEPCKRSNLQEGAMNAKVWASKSLASVSFGEASSSRVGPVSSTH
nr:5'-adenylylsulfate reductase-like 4 [Ipomoea batatas]